MSTYTMRREHAGSNEMQSITPVCSCGWRGRAEYAYNDWQHTNVKEQEAEHARTHRAALSTQEKAHG